MKSCYAISADKSHRSLKRSYNNNSNNMQRYAMIKSIYWLHA